MALYTSEDKEYQIILKSIVREGDASFEYRSHYNGLQLMYPNNYVLQKVYDKEDNEYHLWFYVTDEQLEDEYILENLDYSKPTDIEIL